MVQRLPLSDAHFRRISQLIYQRAGIVLADNKREMVYNRLVRRLHTLNIYDFGRYLALLENYANSAEWQAFINALTTNLTAFFREAHHFPVLAEHARKRAGSFNFWCAAASIGEEPYSIAMTLAETLGAGPGKFQAHASDIDMQVLEKAVAGVYREEELRTLSQQQLLQRFFPRGTGLHAGMVRALELGAVDFSPSCSSAFAKACWPTARPSPTRFAPRRSPDCTPVRRCRCR
nr:Chemotaxis response regulator protein-glutamatemethylesterase [Candidatus Pantoea persica]